MPGEVPKDKKSREILLLQRGVEDILQGPEMVDSRLREASPFADHSVPEVYAGMSRNLRRAAEFLSMKLPSLVGGGGVFPVANRVSGAEYAKIQRYVSAAMQPYNLLAEMNSGNVRRETVEAVKYVYPEMYNQIQTYIMQMTTTNPRLSHNQKLQMGILFDVPTTPALEQLVSRQQTAMQNEIERQQAEQRMREAPGKIAKVLADQSKTTAERVAS